MADIRIKDLTTLESASLTGDVFVIDGTTGTRKLSAFSPTFGGNATVTGTLTVNGGATVGGGSFAAASFYKSSSLGSVLSGATGSSYDLYITNPAGNYILQVPTGTRNAEFAGTLTTVGNATVGAALTVQATTASTTTSTGALVVGNGTSGGLGVGGAIVAGGTITSTTSTDSGVLQLNLVNSSTGTSASSLFRFNAGTRTATLQAYNDTHATLAGQLRVGTSNGDIVVLPSGVTAATFTASGTTFAGAIAIGNTVNTVSPTSPNRTITMVIGGTTYYLAAKTTND